MQRGPKRPAMVTNNNSVCYREVIHLFGMIKSHFEFVTQVCMTKNPSHCRKSAVFSTRDKIGVRSYDFFQVGLVEAVAGCATNSIFFPCCFLVSPGKTVWIVCAFLLALLRFIYQISYICTHQLLPVFYCLTIQTWILG